MPFGLLATDSTEEIPLYTADGRRIRMFKKKSNDSDYDNSKVAENRFKGRYE